MTPYYRADGVALYLGDCCEIMPRLTFDHVIADPPYSPRTHGGHNCVRGVQGRRGIEYEPWEPWQVLAFVEAARVCPGWLVAMTDDVLQPYWRAYLEAAGRYVFAPVPYVAAGSRFRMYGDGPASWTVWLQPARPKEQRFVGWGSLPGAYVLPKGEGERDMMIGGKPLWLMEALVRDYSRSGDAVLDPVCGSGTTMLAARRLGRQAVGIDQSEEALRRTAERLRQAGFG